MWLLTRAGSGPGCGARQVPPSVGRTRGKVDPSPSRESTSTRPWWLLATWRTMDRPSPVPPVSRLRPVVDPVEALEDAVEVAGGDADALVGDAQADLAVGRSARDTHRGVRRRRRSRRSRAGCSMAETSWRRSPSTCTGGIGLLELDGDVALLGGRADPLDGLGHDQVDAGPARAAAPPRTRSGDRSSRSSMIRLTRKASVWMRAASRWATSGSGSDDQGLGQQAERAHRGLELVADVGHEVAADLLEAPALGDVLDDGDDPERPPAVVDQPRPHGQGAARAARRGRGCARPSPPCQAFSSSSVDGLGGQRVAVAVVHQRDGPGVAEDHGRRSRRRR